MAPPVESEHVRFPPARELGRRLVHLANTQIFIHHQEFHRGVRVNRGKFRVSHAQLLFGSLAFGNVERGAAQLNDPSGGIALGFTADDPPASLAIRKNRLRLDLVGCPILAGSLHRGLQTPPTLRSVEALKPLEARDGLFRIAAGEAVKFVRPRDGVALEIPYPATHTSQTLCLLEFVRFLPQGALAVLPFRDLLNHHVDAYHPVAGGPQGVEAGQPVTLDTRLSRRGPMDFHVGHRHACVENAPEQRLQCGRQIRQGIPKRAAKVLGYRQAVDLGKAPVDAQEPQVGVDYRESHRRVRIDAFDLRQMPFQNRFVFEQLLSVPLALGDVPEPDGDTAPCRRQDAHLQPSRQTTVVIFQRPGNALRHDAPALEFQFAPAQAG